MITEQLAVVFQETIRTPQYFTGRLLSAEDLRADQRSGRARLRQLGQAVGEGVVRGFNVTRTNPDRWKYRLTISAGLAINREGEVLQLDEDIHVDVLDDSTPIIPPSQDFNDCIPRARARQPVKVGAFILVAGSATADRDREPVEGVMGLGAFRRERGRFTVPGVYFSLVRFELSDFLEYQPNLARDLEVLSRNAELSPEQTIKLRNGMAHLCLGTEEIEKMPETLMDCSGSTAESRGYGVVDHLRDRALIADEELPIAAFFCDQRGVLFVDLHAVRRPPVPRLSGVNTTDFYGMRRTIEGQACLLQFQNQICDMINSLSAKQLLNINACDHFHYLPPFGLLPLHEKDSAGFDPRKFFRGLDLQQRGELGPGLILPLSRKARDYLPVQTDSGSASVQLYPMSQPQKGSKSNPLNYSVFTTGEMPPAQSGAGKKG